MRGGAAATLVGLVAIATLPSFVTARAKISEQSLLLPFKSGRRGVRYSLSASAEAWEWHSSNTSVVSLSSEPGSGNQQAVNVTVEATWQQRAFATVEARRGGEWHAKRAAGVLNGHCLVPPPLRTTPTARCPLLRSA